MEDLADHATSDTKIACRVETGEGRDGGVSVTWRKKESSRKDEDIFLSIYNSHWRLWGGEGRKADILT